MGFWSDSLLASATSKSAINISRNAYYVIVIVYVVPCKYVYLLCFILYACVGRFSSVNLCEYH